jgi:enoyl-[acyl-carrier-protein] reductase (NADH)
MDYVISKSSIPNLTRFIATNYGRKKIRSNCVVPHGIKNFHKKDLLKNILIYHLWAECQM